MVSRQNSTASSEEGIDPGSGPFTSCLSSLFVLHRGLGSTDEAASEAEQYEKVLYYYPGNHSITRQLQLVGFAEGLIEFTGRFGEGREDEAVQIVNLKKRCFCFHPCEADVWLVAVLKEPTGVVGDGSDRYSVNSSAVRTLLRLMYQTFALFHGPIRDALAGSKEGMELLERVRGLRKQSRKLSQRIAMLEAGYDEDGAREEGGTVDSEAASLQHREGRRAQLEGQREEVEETLAKALAASPITLLQRQLQAFLQVYVAGVDLENVHLLENMPGFHMVPADPRLYRKIHLLQHRLCEVLSTACQRSLLGLSLVQDGHILAFAGMSRDEMLLVYNYLKTREFAHAIHPNPGALSSLPSSSPLRRTPSTAYSPSRPVPPPPPQPPSLLQTTVASALESYSKARHHSRLLSRLSGLAQRLKAGGGGDAEPTKGVDEDQSVSGATNGTTASATRGFLAEDGLRYLNNIASDGSARIWLPRLHPLTKTEEKGKKDAVPRPWRRLAVYASGHVLALLVLQEDTLQRAGTQTDTPTTPTEGEAQFSPSTRPCIDPQVLTNLCAEIEAVLGPEMALAFVPPSDRLSAHPPSSPALSTTNTSSSGGSALPAGLEPSRFIYYNRVNNSFLTSHPTFCLKGLKAWPPPTLCLLKHRHCTLSALALAVLDEFNLQLRDATWGDRDTHEGAFREMSLRTRDDGWVLARQSCGREVYALVDGRLSSILDAQQAFDVLITQCFANVHVP